MTMMMDDDDDHPCHPCHPPFFLSAACLKSKKFRSVWRLPWSWTPVWMPWANMTSALSPYSCWFRCPGRWWWISGAGNGALWAAKKRTIWRVKMDENGGWGMTFWSLENFQTKPDGVRRFDGSLIDVKKIAKWINIGYTPNLCNCLPGWPRWGTATFWPGRLEPPKVEVWLKICNNSVLKIVFPCVLNSVLMTSFRFVACRLKTFLGLSSKRRGWSRTLTIWAERIPAGLPNIQVV